MLAADLAVLNFDIDKTAPGSQEATSRLAEAIGEADPDLVALQNAWRLGDGSALPRLGLPYYGGRMRNGLIVLSRFPIIEERWQAFSCPMSRLRRSGLRQIDSGILLVRMQTPQGPVDAYNTRFIADEGAVQYRTLRMTQIFELASMVETYSAGKPFLILGDLGQDSDRRLLGNLLGLHHSLLPGDADAQQASLPAEMFKPVALRRIEALGQIEEASARMIETFRRRLTKGSWFPIYGFMLTLRYERQINQLETIKIRAQTARIRTLASASKRKTSK
ncbi:MAG: hypothetical protein A3J74_10080 [Elusimicrobia bacterium RIFCSPHIGHO2_02_FULL_57_9]|nr:MAG: hypothetical protein A3J74_10080 [Elusimicrobia bacterium RIFCSPHIGHO2_02_FULL_57_9]